MENNFKQKKSQHEQIYGKLPPQNIQLEADILGAVMLEKSAYDLVNDILQPDCFYTEAHQKIYAAIQILVGKNYPIDMMTVCNELKNAGNLDMVGGPMAMMKLTNGVVSSANIEVHSRIVLEKYLLRELIRISGEVITKAYDETNDVFDILDYTEENVSGLRMNNVRKDFTTIQKVIVDNLNRLEELRMQEEAITGVTSGFKDLDDVTAGWQDTDLIILAARPSVGKTAFALTLAKNATNSFKDQFLQKKVTKQKAVAFFSLEMSCRQLGNRLLSSDSEIWLKRFKNGRVDDFQMNTIRQSGERLNKINFLIDDTAALKIQEFKTKARIMVRKHNVVFIIIDYLQLMRDPSKGNNREREISSISSQLKETAKELGVPIIALSQLSRDYGKGGVREPQLSDLRESGAIEQDADVVIFLFKPSEETIADDRSLEQILYAKIAKHRNGDAPVKFISQFLKDTQSHPWLKKIDDHSLAPISESFKPVVIDYSMPKSQQQLFDDEDIPAPF